MKKICVNKYTNTLIVNASFNCKPHPFIGEKGDDDNKNDDDYYDYDDDDDVDDDEDEDDDDDYGGEFNANITAILYCIMQIKIVNYAIKYNRES